MDNFWPTPSATVKLFPSAMFLPAHGNALGSGEQFAAADAANAAAATRDANEEALNGISGRGVR